MSVRLGVVGCGSVFWTPYMSLIERLRGQDRVEVTAVYDADPDKRHAAAERLDLDPEVRDDAAAARRRRRGRTARAGHDAARRRRARGHAGARGGPRRRPSGLDGRLLRDRAERDVRIRPDRPHREIPWSAP